MIKSAIVLLRDELIAYLAVKDPAATVIADNIGLFETTDGKSLTKNIVITLVNIEEESTLKNQPALKRPFVHAALYENPPVYLNLYVLITCNYSGGDYLDALNRLSLVFRFLQSKNSFSLSSTVTPDNVTSNDADIVDLKFTLELYTLTFEQINHLWGSLGGRQMPFAMYKLRLVAISEHVILREVPLIEEIESNLNSIV